MKVDAIVPCYNEAPRLDGVLRILQSSNLINKIIFVDGGSNDHSIDRAKKYDKVELVSLTKKGGKGQDVREGLKKVVSPLVFLCDADLHGLNESHFEKMLAAFEKNPQALIVGLTQKNRFYFYHWIRANLFPTISGMRVITTQDLEKVLSHPLSCDWGIEPYMNYYFAKNGRPIIKILLDGVNDIPKPKKMGYGWKPHLKEAYDVVQKYVLIYARELPKDFYADLKSFIYPQYPEDKTIYTTHFLKVDGIKMNFAQVGQGPGLILVHGWANNWEGWKPVIPLLKKEFTLYLVDLPGFGDSDNLKNYSVQILADYLFNFSLRLKQRPTAAIALSMGTLILAELDRQHPGFFKKLILIGPPIRSGKNNLVARTLRYSLWFLQNLKVGETAIKKLIETRLAGYAVSKYVNMYRFNRFLVDAYGMIGKKKMRKEAFTQMGISGAGYDLKDNLEKITAPTLLLYGREDKISSPNFARDNLLPKNRRLNYASIPEAGHVVPWEKPQEVAEEIKKFLITK